MLLAGRPALELQDEQPPLLGAEAHFTAIRHFRAVCLDANPARARLAMRTVFDAPAAGSVVVLRTRVAGTDHELVHPSAAGENRVEWTVEVPAPDLWWPHRLGHQPLHELRLDVVVDGEVHDTRHVSIGFRSVRMHDWALIVNGERLFIKGTSVLPTRPLLGDASGPEIAADVTAARDAGLDLIRPIAHIARPELYEAADRSGMLIWQDLPIRGVMSRGVRDQARRQAREAVDLLGHHPSVALWCAHDEPFARPVTPSATPGLIGQQRPSWNRAVLDRALRRVLERTDGSRPVINLDPGICIEFLPYINNIYSIRPPIASIVVQNPASQDAKQKKTSR